MYAKLVCAHGHVRILWPIRARTIRSKVPLVEEVHNPNATGKKRGKSSQLIVS